MELVESMDAQEKLARALEEMISALRILDELDLPAQVASHLDLAICQLERRLGADSHASPGAGALHANLADELRSSTGVEAVPCPWH